MHIYCTPLFPITAILSCTVCNLEQIFFLYLIQAMLILLRGLSFSLYAVCACMFVCVADNKGAKSKLCFLFFFSKIEPFRDNNPGVSIRNIRHIVL